MTFGAAGAPLNRGQTVGALCDRSIARTQAVRTGLQRPHTPRGYVRFADLGFIRGRLVGAPMCMQSSTVGWEVAKRTAPMNQRASRDVLGVDRSPSELVEVAPTR